MVRHLKQSRNHVDSDVEIQILHQRHYQEQTHGQEVDERVLRHCEAIRAGGRAEIIFSLAASHLPVACRGMEHVRPGTRLCHARERSGKWDEESL
jgi:hypothetical protein